jgi:hypothetical protein
VQNEAETPAGVVHHFPGAPNRANLTLREFADVYMANFAGRDASRPYSVAFWVRELGDRRILDIDADAIADVLDRMVTSPVHKYAGKDPATGKPILRTHPRKRAPATINRLKSVISSMLTYAQRRRLMPKGWTNPAKEIPCERVSNACTRFLSTDERERLLRVCRISTWNKLYLLVLMMNRPPLASAALALLAVSATLPQVRAADTGLSTSRASTNRAESAGYGAVGRTLTRGRRRAHRFA